jgi:hypothetical protein
MDALESFSTIDAVVEVSYSFGVPHTHACITFDKFTTMTFLFSAILNYNVLLYLQVAVPYGDEPCPPGMDN